MGWFVGLGLIGFGRFLLGFVVCLVLLFAV